MSQDFNPKVQVGDKVVCYHMAQETSVLPGTKGVVKEIKPDPFTPGVEMIYVDWDNGSRLPLLSDEDIWTKIETKPIEEQDDKIFRLYQRNPDLFNYFDYYFFRDFLIKMRDSGIVNMFGSSPLIYAGRDHIDRYYGEGQEDNEDFQDLLDMADEARQKLVQGILKYTQEKNIDLEDDYKINSLAKKFSKDLLNFYIASF